MDEPIKTREIREIASRYQAVTSDILERVVNRLVQAFNPKSIILYGSYAEGLATRDSDLDFLVITSHPITRLEEQERLRGSFNDIPIPMQVITISKEEFEETRDVIGGIAYPAAAA